MSSLRWLCVLISSAALAQTAAPAPESPASTPSAAELMRAAMNKQQAASALQLGAIRRQAESAGASMMPMNAKFPGAASMECERLAPETVNPIIESAARK